MARKTAETPKPQAPPTLRGTRGNSQITYCGDNTLNPSMNASKSAAANRGNCSGSNLSLRCSRYITATVTTNKATVSGKLRALKNSTPRPLTSKAPYSGTPPSSHPSFINTEDVRLSNCNPRLAWYVKLSTKRSPPNQKAGKKKTAITPKNTANPRAASLSVRAPSLWSVRRDKGRVASAGTSLAAAPKPKEAQARVSAVAARVPPYAGTIIKVVAAASVRATIAS